MANRQTQGSGYRVARWLTVVFTLSLISLASMAATDTGLIDSARKQNWQAVQDRLQDDAVDVNATLADGTTALAWAAYWDDVETVRRLMDAGADPDLGNDYGVTPLFLAVENRSIAMVQTLLAGGADANAALWSGETLLMATARTGLIKAMQMLLEHGADVNAQEPRRHQSALMWAISFGYPDAARLLIEHGADVNARTIQLNEEFRPLQVEGYMGSVIHAVPQGGYTPLLFVARSGDMETARLLIGKGADVNLASKTDGSPLIMAASQGYEDLAIYFLEQGAEPNVKDGNGLTPLHYAFRDGIKVLHGQIITDKDMVCNFGGEGFLCRPYETLNDQQVEYFEDPDSEVYLVKPNQYDQSRPLPGTNMHRLAEELLSRGARVDAAMELPPAALRLERNPWFSMRGATPLFLAAASQDLAGVEMLLEEAANPLVETHINEDVYYVQANNPAEDNMVVGTASALMAAVGMGRRADMTIAQEERAVQIAERLIGLGADVNEHTITGWTPLHAAAFLGHDKLIRFLVEKGAEVNVLTGCGRSPISLAMANDTAGMLDRTLPRIETAELLLELGAGDEPPQGPLGECIGGRGGLDADESQNQLVREAIRAVQRQLEQKQQQWSDEAAGRGDSSASGSS